MTSRMKKVYVAGPITGASYDQATTWREDFCSDLKRYGILGFSPMRGKAYLSKEDKLKDSYSDHTMSSITGINVRDFNDVKTADAIFVNFLGAEKVSIGSVMEIAWARAFQIPVVIALSKGSVHDHGMLTFGNVIVPTLEEGLFAIRMLLTTM